jgi:hypothetical protein
MSMSYLLSVLCRTVWKVLLHVKVVLQAARCLFSNIPGTCRASERVVNMGTVWY